VNTLLEGPSRMPFYTDLAQVFAAFGGRQCEFNWLITDLECNWHPPELSHQPIWIAGADLTELIARTTQDAMLQFIWGVLSAFRREVRIDAAALEVYPRADGNAALWEPDVRIQHPRAELEIVCWDSTSTLLLSRDDDLSRRFRAYFPEAVDLDDYNREQQRARDASRPIN